MDVGRVAWVAITLAIGGTAFAGVDLSRTPPESAADCDQLVARYPDDHEAYRCYLVAARRNAQWGDAVRALDARLAVDPSDRLASLYLGWIEADRYRPRAEELLRAATAGAESAGDAIGEVRARLTLAQILGNSRRYEEASAQVVQAAEAARGSGLGFLEGYVLAQRAKVAAGMGEIATARALYGEIENRALYDGVAPLRAEVENGLGWVAWIEGRLPEAQAHYEKAAAAHRSIADRYAEAVALYNVCAAAGRRLYRGISLDELRALNARALEAAVESGNGPTESAVRLLMAQDPEIPIGHRIAEAQRAMMLTADPSLALNGCRARRTLAQLIATRDGPDGLPEALAILDDAIAMARSVGSRADEARAWILRGGMFPDEQTRDEIVAAYSAAVEQIESMRDLVSDDTIRGRWLWDWAFVYHRMAGYLLERASESRDMEDADLAFRTVERLRARARLEALDTAGATVVATPRADPEVAAALSMRNDIVARISEVQRRMVTIGTTPQELHAAQKELARLENDEAALRERIAVRDRDWGTLRRARPAGIAEVQAALDDDEAVLAFHLSTREGGRTTQYWNGGSWVFAITREAWHVAPLPDRDLVDERVAVYLGLLERRDRYEPGAAVRLYDDLVAEALLGLPETVSQLIVVPDGALHRIPFAALRSDPAADPLAARFEISRVPSASTWLGWRTVLPGTRAGAALAIADPEIRTDVAAAAFRARGAYAPPLGPLPWARAEGAAMVQAIGSGTLRVGRNATERSLKQDELGRYGVLHLAAHAVVNDRSPQRSAIVLAPGADDEDGLLQIREIVGLDLDDAVVVLSACSSATGEVTAGEGVLGLARGFFQAGARTVIGGLWPLRDDEAARLVEGIADRLGAGESVGAAVAASRRVAIAQGLPAAAWAGIVVLGDAAVVPVPGGSTRGRRSMAGPVAVASGAFVLAIAVAVIRRRRSA